MRSMLFATVATFGVTFGIAAMAQTTNADMAPANDQMMPQAAPMMRPGHSPGVGLSEPASTNASNITASDTRSVIAPRLPGAAAPGINQTAGQLLRMAQDDLSRHQTGAAQEALERAETRLLDRSTPAGMTDAPDRNAVVLTISQAREALGHHDVAGAQSLVSKAMSQATPG
jgi:hypothetical protein